MDAIDEGVAWVEEDGERMISLPRHLLAAGTKEGQRLTVTRATLKGTVTLVIAFDPIGSAAELEQSRAQTSAILAESKKRDPEGNVSL